MKKIAVVCVVLIVLVIGVVLAKGMIARAAFLKGVRAVTGLGVEAEGVDLGLFKTYLTVRGLKIANPEGYTDRVMADLPLIHVDYNLGDFFKGKAHLEDLALELKELVVVLNTDNRVNLHALQALIPQGQGEQPQLSIDILHLKIGKVVFKNYALGRTDVREYNLNLSEDFSGIDGPKALIGLILSRALSKTDVPALTGIDMTAIKESISAEVTRQSQSALQELTTKAEEKLKGLFQQ